MPSSSRRPRPSSAEDITQLTISELTSKLHTITHLLSSPPSPSSSTLPHSVPDLTTSSLMARRDRLLSRRAQLELELELNNVDIGDTKLGESSRGGSPRRGNPNPSAGGYSSAKSRALEAIKRSEVHFAENGLIL